MKPNDIHRLRGLELAPFALVAQGETFDFLDTVVIIPLIQPDDVAPIDIITPRIMVESVAYHARTELIGAAPRTALGPYVMTANSRSLEISRAIDLLTTGF